MAEDAADMARAQVAAAVCVNKFMEANDARVQIASLQQIRNSWQRKDCIEKGGWAKIAGQNAATSRATMRWVRPLR